ncbi:hypothetical protein LNP74_14095 [Klebsiella pneumoniae subsp. pneumoniae]|nr:hypothetical protein [Klebsiella pneumoniae subsp. pneumoniae]
MGRPERNDMVEYFGEHLGRFYLHAKPAGCRASGSRCVKPPVVIRRRQPSAGDHRRLGEVRAVPDRQAGERDAHWTGDHSVLVPSRGKICQP